MFRYINAQTCIFAVAVTQLVAILFLSDREDCPGLLTLACNSTVSINHQFTILLGTK